MKRDEVPAENIDTTNFPTAICSSHINNVLQRATSYISDHGLIASPRGRETKEVLNCTLFLSDARNGICTLKNRKTSYKLIAAEFLMYVCGWGRDVADAQLLCDLVPSYSAYRNEHTLRFDSPYGPHINTGIYNVVQILQRDRDSRQAVIPIFNAMHSNLAVGGHSRDISCTVTLHYLLRNNKLHAVSYMRSNDLFYGTPHDVAAFTLVQRFIAAVLGVEVGTYTHHTGSLHIYSDKIDELHEKMYGEETVELFDIDFHDISSRNLSLHNEIERLESLLFGAQALQRARKESSDTSLEVANINKLQDKILAGQAPDLLPLWYGLTGRLIKKGTKI